MSENIKAWVRTHARALLEASPTEKKEGVHKGVYCCRGLCRQMIVRAPLFRAVQMPQTGELTGCIWTAGGTTAFAVICPVAHAEDA